MNTFKMEKSIIKKKLKLHSIWVNSKGNEGRRADLSYTNLREADLEGANLRKATLKRADLEGAHLKRADLSYTDLSEANLMSVDLRGANLEGAYLSVANLKDADLSGAKGLCSQILFLNKNFEKSKNGYICYKTFNSTYIAPNYWNIVPNSIIEEIVDFDRTNSCSYGINVATLSWIKKNNNNRYPIWKCLIEWEWLAGVCVPYDSDGKIRCERVRLLEIVED